MSRIINAKVKSSQIEELSYNEETQELVATFKGSTQYLYSGVPLDVYISVITSDSVGKEFNAKVKAGGYEFAKLEKAEDETPLSLLDRIKDEYNELQIKNFKLHEFFGTDTFKDLDEPMQKMIDKQHTIMGQYLEILSDRYVALGGVWEDLDEPIVL